MSKNGNVTLIAAKKGYFLTIKDEFTGVENTWAVTQDELKNLFSLITNLLPFDPQEESWREPRKVTL